ncbi:uncharacterized protein EI97DRAFT_433355 [Westerdykella ornata]|uniref:Uncharacterized protein n=1 Tax=Westerdykella ornata TaxID=318751 RepID=A0A6A6JJT3_WESOR|nr:uncharacterized protein EI97DRAFT_433355 [Westerdykella ornata]KAF2276524.1 hypothetical protein EI97DRAFT_433355 [Westerdykella ornata]
MPFRLAPQTPVAQTPPQPEDRSTDTSPTEASTPPRTDLSRLGPMLLPNRPRRSG